MKKRTLQTVRVILAALLAMAGCDGDGNGETDGDAAEAADVQDTQDTDAAEDVPEDFPAEDMVDGEDVEKEDVPPPPRPLAFTTNTAYDFSSGSYSVFLKDISVVEDVLSIHADSVVRCAGGMPVILERFGADTVTLIDDEYPFPVEDQFSVEGGSNPVDIDILSSGGAVVTRNNVTTAAIVDLGDGTLNTGSLDLAGFADDDGIPEMSAVVAAEGKIFIALQLLDRDTELWNPTGPGLVVVFEETTLELIDTDTSTGEVDGIALAGSNPQPRFQASPAGGQIFYIAAVGFYGVADGGIEGINVSTYEATGFIVTEETLGGDIAAWVIVDDDKGYAAVSKPGFAGDKLVQFNPSDGTLVNDDIMETGAFSMTSLALTRDGRLLVVDRNLEGAGVRILNTETGEETTASPIATGVAPFSICVP